MITQALINSRFGVAAALTLGRILPPPVGYRLAQFASGRLAARRQLPMVQAVRLNQWVASGYQASSAQLDQAVRLVFANTARCIYDLYHNLHDPNRIEARLQYTPQARAIFKEWPVEAGGLLILGIHLGNFDLVMHILGRSGLRALVLSYPQPGKAYRWQNEMRQKAGLELLPASTASLRRAVKRLQCGGIVATGIDRPLPDAKLRPSFFGRPSALPVSHVSLALLAKVPVVVAASIVQPDGTYRIEGTPPITLQPHPDRQVELVSNAGLILEAAAGFITQAPEQWAMFYPVWPEAASEVPYS